MIGDWIRGLRRRLRRNDFERGLDRELAFHIECETEENIRRGMSPEAARRAALVSLGGVEQTKEDVREASGLLLVENFLQDARFAIRSLRRNPGYTAVVLATLALGIGANAAIFSVVYGVLLRPLPYGAGDRIVALTQARPAVNDQPVPFSAKEIADYRDLTHSFDAVAEYHSMSFILLGNAEPQRVRTGVVSAEYFDMLGVTPVAGRTFVRADDAPGAEPVLVLSHRYWMQNFGGDASVVGRTFQMNDRAHTVVGVLPPLPPFPDDNDVYMCTSACPFRSSPHMADDRTMGMMKAFGRLRPGATPESAAADVRSVADRLREIYPDVYPAGSGYTARLAPLRDVIAGDARPALLVLLGTGLLVLLIACANVANLTLARTARREHELAVRSTLGAGRGRLARQLFAEGIVVAVAAGALGLALAAVGLRVLLLFVAHFVPRADEIALDEPVLLFTLVASVVAGLAFSAMPALAARSSLVASLAGGARVAAGPQRARAALIALQVGAAFVLLICAGLMLRSLAKLHAVDAGFDEQHVISMHVDLNWSKYPTPESTKRFFDRLYERVTASPDVISAAFVSGLPLDGRPFYQNVSLEGDPLPAPPGSPQADVTVVSPGYFATMGIPLLSGRDFRSTDDERAPLVAVISEAMARHRWQGVDPVGARFTVDDGEHWITVVGVVGDVKTFGLSEDPGDEVYAAYAQNPSGGRLVVRTNADAGAMTRFVRTCVYELDPDQPVTEPRTLAELRSRWLAPSRLTTTLLALLGALALTITVAGIGGVMALWVSQRTREIGVRMALGASRRRVVGLVLRQGMTIVAVGLVLGIVSALATTRFMAGLLFGVGATDAATFAGVAAVLVAAAVAACSVPARHATAIDPMEALRSE